MILRAKKSRVSIGFCARLYPSGTILTLLFSTQINEFGLLFSVALAARSIETHVDRKFPDAE